MSAEPLSLLRAGLIRLAMAVAAAEARVFDGGHGERYGVHFFTDFAEMIEASARREPSAASKAATYRRGSAAEPKATGMPSSAMAICSGTV